MKSLKYIVPLALFLVLAGFLAVGLNRDPREVPSPLIGKPAPAFALTRLDDANVTIKRDDLLGKVWILNVWASWCAPCRDEHPALVDFARRKPVPVIGLNYKDQRRAGSDWLRQLGNPYDATLFDSDGRVGIDFGVYGVPETFVMDKAGIVRFKHTGVLTPEIIATRIEPLLVQLNAS
jgi:cytochrome c biogenesis protein CcmG, thiol:disulfide interchange protein DsbE